MAFFLPISPEKQAKELGEAGNYVCSLTCCDVFGLSLHLNFGFEQVLACLGLCAPELKAAQNGVRYERKWAGDLCEPAVHADSGRWRCSLKVGCVSRRCMQIWVKKMRLEGGIRVGQEKGREKF